MEKNQKNIIGKTVYGLLSVVGCIGTSAFIIVNSIFHLVFGGLVHSPYWSVLWVYYFIQFAVLLLVVVTGGVKESHGFRVNWFHRKAVSSGRLSILLAVLALWGFRTFVVTTLLTAWWVTTDGQATAGTNLRRGTVFFCGEIPAGTCGFR